MRSKVMSAAANDVMRGPASREPTQEPGTRRGSWTTLLGAQLWLLAAFVGMSLIVTAAELWLWDNGLKSPRELAMLVLAGGVLVSLALRYGRRLIDSERAAESAGADSGPSSAAGAGRPAQSAKHPALVPHR